MAGRGTTDINGGKVKDAVIVFRCRGLWGCVGAHDGSECKVEAKKRRKLQERGKMRLRRKRKTNGVADGCGHA